MVKGRANASLVLLSLCGKSGCVWVMGCQKIPPLAVAAPIAVRRSVHEAACRHYSSVQYVQQRAMQFAEHCAVLRAGHSASSSTQSGSPSSAQSIGHCAVRTAAYGAHTRTVSATRWCSELSLLLSLQASAAGVFSICSGITPVSLLSQRRDSGRESQTWHEFLFAVCLVLPIGGSCHGPGKGETCHAAVLVARKCAGP